MEVVVDNRLMGLCKRGEVLETTVTIRCFGSKAEIPFTCSSGMLNPEGTELNDC